MVNDTPKNEHTGRIIWFWEELERISKDARAFLQDPQLYDSIEHLYNAIKERDKQRQLST